MDKFLFFPFSEREGWVKAHEITAGERYSWAEGLCWGDSTLSSKHWQTETLKEEHLFIYFSFSYKYSVLTSGLPWQCSKLQVVGGVETQKRSLSPPPPHTHTRRLTLPCWKSWLNLEAPGTKAPLGDRVPERKQSLHTSHFQSRNSLSPNVKAIEYLSNDSSSSIMVMAKGTQMQFLLLMCLGKENSFQLLQEGDGLVAMSCVGKTEQNVLHVVTLQSTAL